LTRLISEQVLKIPATLASYDRQLTKIIGWSLKELAQASVGFDSADTAISNSSYDSSSHFSTDSQSCRSRDNNPLNAPALKISAVKETVNPSSITAANSAAAFTNPADHRVAVIPITTGQGQIKGFSEALCAIAGHLGFPAFITNATDVAGLAEACQSDASIVLMADDHCYIAFNLLTRRLAGNDEATAKGYTTALKKMAGGLAAKEILLIGAGPLGTAAAQSLLREGTSLMIHDLVSEKEDALAESLSPEERKQITTGFTLEQALSSTNLIFDASCGEGFIPAALLKPDACIAAPGLPLGLDAAAARQYADRLIHDPLQIGTAVMLFQALQRGHSS